MILFIFFPLVRSLSFSLFSLFMNLIRALILLLLCCYVVAVTGTTTSVQNLASWFWFHPKEEGKKKRSSFGSFVLHTKKTKQQKRKSEKLFKFICYSYLRGLILLAHGDLRCKSPMNTQNSHINETKTEKFTLSNDKNFLLLVHLFSLEFLVAFSFQTHNKNSN